MIVVMVMVVVIVMVVVSMTWLRIHSPARRLEVCVGLKVTDSEIYSETVRPICSIVLKVRGDSDTKLRRYPTRTVCIRISMHI